MALERFIPKSPDMFIRNSQDFEVAKFGHLNTIVEYINNNSAKPAGLNGYVQFNDNSALGGDAGLFWDNVNKRLGVGTVTPLVPLNIYNNNAGISSVILVEQDTAAIIGQINQYRKNGSVNLVSGAEIGRLSFGGYFNSTYSPFSQVCSAVLGYYGGTGTDRVGGLRLVTWNGGGQTTRLQVSPDGKIGIGTTAPSAKLSILGEGSTSATTALLVQNSLGTQSFSVNDDRIVSIPYRVETPFIRNSSGNLVLFAGNFEVEIQSSNPTNVSGSLRTTGQITTTDNGTKSIINVNNLVPSTSASFGTLNGFAFTSTITQTTGTIRGIYINPTLTASTDFRAIETTVGNVLLATTSGNVGIGTSSPTSKLYLDGGIFTKKYYTDTADQTINFGSAYELFGTPHASSGYSFFINPTGFSSGWDVNIGNATTYFNFNYSTGFSAFKVNATALILGESELSFYKSSPDTGWSYNSAGGWDFVIRGSADEKLRIKSGGNVLIGTSTDLGGKLSIKGSGSTSSTTSLLVQNSSGTTILLLNDTGTLSVGNGNQGTINAGTLNLGYPNTITYNSSYNMIIGGTTAGSGTISIDGSSIRFLAANNGITYTQPIAKSFLIKKEQGGADATSFLNISGADQTDAGQAGAGGVVRIYGGLNNGIATQGLLILAHNGTTTQGAVVVGGTSANAAALLDIQSTTKGFLYPRMTTAERVAIASPPNGLMVFDTDVQNLCYRRDGVWVQATFAAV